MEGGCWVSPAVPVKFLFHLLLVLLCLLEHRLDRVPQSVDCSVQLGLADAGREGLCHRSLLPGEERQNRGESPGRVLLSRRGGQR